MIVACGFCIDGDRGGIACAACGATGKIDVQIGTPCTFHIGSDSYPCTVVDVTAQTIVTRDDRARKPGIFEPMARQTNGDTNEKRFRLVRGRWRRGNYLLSVGRREIKLDPSF